MKIRQKILELTRPDDAVNYHGDWFVPISPVIMSIWCGPHYKYAYQQIEPRLFFWERTQIRLARNIPII